VIASGLNVVDILFIAPETIRPDAKHPVDQLTVQGGAPAGNAACLLASLGWRTAYLGHFGDNTLSLIARNEFTRHGVLPDLFIETPEARPAVAVVQVDPRTGERTVFYTLSGYRHLAPEDIPADAIRSARLLLLDGYEIDANLAALRIARRAGIPAVLDLEAGDPATLLEMIRLGSDAILPLEAARRLTERDDAEAALEALRAQAPDTTLLVTDGLRGSWALAPGEPIRHQPAFPVRAVDTTGCGDAYHGAYASALLQGWPLSLRMEFAAWVASRVALGLGGRACLPTRASLSQDDLSTLSAALRDAIAKLA